jgi:hypothetical protein
MVTTLLSTINMLSSSIPYIIHKTLYTMRKTNTQTLAQIPLHKHQIFMYFNENTQTQFVRFSITPKNFCKKESKKISPTKYLHRPRP